MKAKQRREALAQRSLQHLLFAVDPLLREPGAQSELDWKQFQRKTWDNKLHMHEKKAYTLRLKEGVH